MPQLKQLTCRIENGPKNIQLREYGTEYGDGVVSTYISVPSESRDFSIHLTSSGYIASGLAMFVFIDGVAQCNRNRRGLVMTDETTEKSLYEVDFRVRQKEERFDAKSFIGREWKFEDLRTTAADNATKLSDDILDNVGTIEVVVLRCRDGKTGRKPPARPAIDDGRGMNLDGACDYPIINEQLMSFGYDGAVDGYPDSPPSDVRFKLWQEAQAAQCVENQRQSPEIDGANDDRDRHVLSGLGKAFERHGYGGFPDGPGDHRHASGSGVGGHAPFISPAMVPPVRANPWLGNPYLNGFGNYQPDYGSAYARGYAEAYADSLGIAKQGRAGSDRHRNSRRENSKASSHRTRNNSKNGGSARSWNNDQNSNNNENDAKDDGASGWHDNPNDNSGNANGNSWDNTKNNDNNWGSPNQDKNNGATNNEWDNSNQNNNGWDNSNQNKRGWDNSNQNDQGWDSSNQNKQGWDSSNQNNNGWNNSNGNDNNNNDKSRDNAARAVNKSNDTNRKDRSRSKKRDKGYKSKAPIDNIPTQPTDPDRPFIKPYWQKWSRTSNSTTDDNSALRTIYVVPEEPLLLFPESVTAKHNISHQVHAGAGKLYAHSTATPQYLDSMAAPYAVFVFRYRGRQTLEGMFKDIDVREDREPYRERISTLTREEVVEKLILAKKAAGYGTDSDFTEEGSVSDGSDEGRNGDGKAEDNRAKEIKSDDKEKTGDRGRSKARGATGGGGDSGWHAQAPTPAGDLGGNVVAQPSGGW